MIKVRASWGRLKSGDEKKRMFATYHPAGNTWEAADPFFSGVNWTICTISGGGGGGG